jgi:prophage regulatory protein
MTTSAVTLTRLPAVLSRIGLSRSEVYRRIATGTFPRPIKLGGRAVVWNSVEIDQWLSDRIAERDALSVSKAA